MTRHSKIPPSSLSRVRKCPASLIPNAADNTTSDAALEGTTAHWAAEQMLHGVAVRPCDVCPETHLEITDDMIVYVQCYVDYVNTIRHGHQLHSNGVEHKVNIPQVHADCWGTLDYYAYNGALYIVDLKYGFRIVEPVDNEQLMAYARGVANELLLPSETRVVLVIVQPRPWHRLGPVREYFTTLADIDAEITSIAHMVEEGLRSAAPPASTGSHCLYCVKAVDCEALNIAACNAVDVTMNCGEMVGMSNNQLSLMLENLEKAQTIIDIKKGAVETRLLELIKEGEVVAGYEASPTYSRKDWLRPKDEMIAIGKAFGIDLIKEVLKTPGEAKKAGMKVDKLAKSVKSGVKLKRNDNNLARIIFSKEV